MKNFTSIEANAYIVTLLAAVFAVMLAANYGSVWGLGMLLVGVVTAVFVHRVRTNRKK
ncbi:hypothetical protein ACUY3K_06170 [Corynebacterium uberis]|uniref:hypothetical protein n=1 Tax=Corynebacterium TaxID=1716 RepID=UPI001D0B2316|nr:MULTISPECIES: hypothetical protein [Corynebacterium]MCZ9309754.1 hypothetical protein [Corynebacterium sp. c6VSa_13]UDL73557.1 hypothetical protein LH391_10845 [Corynebacterium uberis]UDL75563.1 hypothetical protein LH393_10080 [Corynebacterium uberis]UDL77776.1 hypothetical protein LH394_10065 [Corynebacterium uberis]UDL80059.1 hypothetical protein LH392_10485 [Corynebacterium uberis]